MATMFSARVSAGKGSFSACLVSENPLVARIAVPEKAENGAANRELVSSLEKLLSCSVRIAAGHKSRKKTLAADCPKEQLVARLKDKAKI